MKLSCAHWYQNFIFRIAGLRLRMRDSRSSRKMLDKRPEIGGPIGSQTFACRR